MALPADFSKIFGSTATGGLTPIGDVNYAKGWEFVGSNPPTKNDFSYLQNLSDLKSQWLYSNKLQRTDPFGDIKSDGSVAVSTALSNLGLGDGSALPVGVPVPWPSATPPTGWLKCNGAPFSAEEYPELAKVYPTNKLPDLRGEFIRGWDDGRGVDSGRSLLSGQAATFIRTAVLDYYGDDLATTAKVGIAFATADSVITVGSPDNPKVGNNSDYVHVLADNSITGTQRATEDNFTGAWISMRPRNLSFNYIVRAA